MVSAMSQRSTIAVPESTLLGDLSLRAVGPPEEHLRIKQKIVVR